ncbi:hypothetical protein [Aequorivita sinensis]|uniref:hypothetical protein n=1 Tax=Aequorivita sinensis TaxID=1382458 RepID=UPI00111CFBBE|nr:hypothetical protein [Aequorivita sinensis]
MKLQPHNRTTAQPHNRTTAQLFKLSFKIFSSFLFLFSNLIYAQADEFCATPAKLIPDPPGVYSKSTDASYVENIKTIVKN